MTSPLYHVNGFNFASPPLLEGAHCVVMEKFDAALAVDLIERHRITLTVMVPTMLQRIARLDGLRPEQLASLETVLYGGSTIPEWLVDRWIDLVGPDVFQLSYGSSERLGLVRMTGREWADHRGATGRPVDATISIRDDDGNELPAGEVGHIYMRPTDPGRRLFEYIGMARPEPTADGYYTVGDMGSVDRDGYLYVADRRKDLIITGGANVFPAEVEAALSEHPAIIDQVVVGVPDPEWGQRVHAIVQPADPAAPPDVEELPGFLQAAAGRLQGAEDLRGSRADRPDRSRQAQPHPPRCGAGRGLGRLTRRRRRSDPRGRWAGRLALPSVPPGNHQEAGCEAESRLVTRRWLRRHGHHS